MKGNRGFTLVELMVAVTIILIAIIPILGSLFGIVYYHRALLDKEIAIGMARVVENLLESQKTFYVIDERNRLQEASNVIQSNDEEYSLVLFTEGDHPKTRLETVVNNRRFIAKAYLRRNPPICVDVDCTSQEYVSYLYSVRIEITWEDINRKHQLMNFVRRFYKR